MTPGEIARGLAAALSRWPVKRAISEINAGKHGWYRHSDGSVHNKNSHFPMGYYPDSHRIVWANGWGQSFKVWPWEHFAIMCAVRLEGVFIVPLADGSEYEVSIKRKDE